MASISLHSPTPLSPKTDAVSSPTNNPYTLAFKSSLFGSKSPAKSLFSLSSTTRNRSTQFEPDGAARVSTRVMASSRTFDVVIVGAGIIGLSIARQLLIGSDLSVAVVDKAVPCSGATGAGQGYIWMAHKKPGSDVWDLTMRSQELWNILAESVQEQGLDPEETLGWKKTGSMLIGRTAEECSMLKRKVKELSEAGLRTEYLSSSDLHAKEPELLVENDSAAAFLPDDSQLDAHRTVAFIEKGNRDFASKGRYAEFYHDPVTSLIRSDCGKEVAGVQTSKNILYSKKAIIVAAGCWSGSLMHELLKKANIVVDVPVKPRKVGIQYVGHLLLLENFKAFHVHHGLMEVGYVDHQSRTLNHTTSTSRTVDLGQMLSVSMTATMDTMGNLVLGKVIWQAQAQNIEIIVDFLAKLHGSSREFVGFNTEVDESVISHIWKRAGEFFPKLRELSIEDFIRSRKVRVGLRPYMPDGKPVIGQVPGLSNLFLATGHEGGGLAMAPGTAEMVVDMVLGNPLHVDSAPFTLQGRCC